MGSERDRYQRASVAEQLGDVVGWFRAHPLALIPVVIVAAGIVLQVVAPSRSTRPSDLAVGDCLYIPTAAANLIGPDARPIGEPSAVAEVLLRGGAERASCSASHGHEVSDVVDMPQPPPTNPRIPGYRAHCDSVLGTYVGRIPDPIFIDSVYATFPVVPDAELWQSGIKRYLCLVARSDGQWMDHPARGSGE